MKKSKRAISFLVIYRLQPNKNKAVILTTGYQKHVLTKTAAGKIEL